MFESSRSTAEPCRARSWRRRSRVQRAEAQENDGAAAVRLRQRTGHAAHPKRRRLPNSLFILSWRRLSLPRLPCTPSSSLARTPPPRAELWLMRTRHGRELGKQPCSVADAWRLRRRGPWCEACDAAVLKLAWLTNNARIFYAQPSLTYAGGAVRWQSHGQSSRSPQRSLRLHKT